MKNEIVLFNDGDLNIEVQISPDQETVWLTQKQMGELFDVKQATLSVHINNILESGELDETSIGFSDKSTGISSKGQITIPKEIRNVLGVDSGEKITFVVVDDEVKIVNTAAYAMKVFNTEMLGQGIKAGLDSEDDVVVLFKGMRSKLSY